MDRWFLQGWRFRPSTHPPHGMGRLGAFVDGIYAIAATLLVLELRLPEEVPAGELGRALAELGPEYAAYAIGFLQMVGGWLQSRRLDSWIRGVDHYATLLILGANGIFSLTPFSTQVLSRAFGDVADLGTAVRLNAALAFVASALYAGLLIYARRTRMFRPDLDPDVFTLYFRLGTMLWLVPPLAWLLSYGSPQAALGLLVALYLLTLLPNEAHPRITS